VNRSLACKRAIAALVLAGAGLFLPALAAPGLDRFRTLDPVLAARVLALDPDRIGATDVRDTLSAVPAPRIILLQGSVAFVTMAPFAEFLGAMGYPLDRIRNPRDGSLSRSSFGDSAALAGEIAWEYERDALMPMLIGHSQGGMLVVRTLHELAGVFGDTIVVRNPKTGMALDRTTIQDPLTGASRPVVGLKVGFAAALATGKLARVLLGQWSMLPLLRQIPDSVDEFSGYSIPGDPIAGNLFGEEPYRAIGTAQVRNVTLPASYSHVALPQALALAREPVTRQYIDDYTPENPAPMPADADVEISNLVHAADLWHSIKKHWCIEAQRALHAARAAP